MKKIYVILCSIISLIIVSVGGSTENIKNIITTNKQFSTDKNYSFSNGVEINLYSTNQIDLNALLSDLMEIDQPDQSIDKIKIAIDERRQDLFPDEEILLLLTDKTDYSRISTSSASGIKQVAQITWWNNSTAYNSYWAAGYYCHAADMFTYVISGMYHLYTYIDEDSYWYYLFTKTVNNVGTWSKPQERNFKAYCGVGGSSSNSAHIVMNFYDGY